MQYILALPCVLIHSSDDGTAFTNEQWNKPLIIRCYGKESHDRIIVDKAKQTYTLDIEEIDSKQESPPAEKSLQLAIHRSALLDCGMLYPESTKQRF